MKFKDLKKSPVVFRKKDHTYWLGDKKLSGITGMLTEYVFPQKAAFFEKMNSYKKTSDILNNAKERGHDVHEQIELTVDGFAPDEQSVEVRMFFRKMKDTEFIAAEYLVSNEESFASAIDILDSECNLYDVKTTSTLDLEYVSWQLSIYAYLFEMQNPHLKAGKLYAAWLRDKKAVVKEVERIDSAVVESLLSAAAAGLPWENPLHKWEQQGVDFLKVAGDQLALCEKVEAEVARIEAENKAKKAERDRLRAGLLELMQQYNLKTYEGEKIKLTVVEPAPKVTCDTERLMADYPELAERYAKTTQASPYLRITIQKND